VKVSGKTQQVTTYIDGSVVAFVDNSFDHIIAAVVIITLINIRLKANTMYRISRDPSLSAKAYDI
jgi:hypothetical protein